MTVVPHGAILIYMEHNEAPTKTVEHPTVADVQYCASLLQVNPAALLAFVMETDA